MQYTSFITLVDNSNPGTGAPWANTLNALGAPGADFASSVLAVSGATADSANTLLTFGAGPTDFGQMRGARFSWSTGQTVADDAVMSATVVPADHEFPESDPREGVWDSGGTGVYAAAGGPFDLWSGSLAASLPSAVRMHCGRAESGNHAKTVKLYGAKIDIYYDKAPPAAGSFLTVNAGTATAPGAGTNGWTGLGNLGTANGSNVRLSGKGFDSCKTLIIPYDCTAAGLAASDTVQFVQTLISEALLTVASPDNGDISGMQLVTATLKCVTGSYSARCDDGEVTGFPVDDGSVAPRSWRLLWDGTGATPPTAAQLRSGTTIELAFLASSSAGDAGTSDAFTFDIDAAPMTIGRTVASGGAGDRRVRRRRRLAVGDDE